MCNSTNGTVNHRGKEPSTWSYVAAFGRLLGFATSLSESSMVEPVRFKVRAGCRIRARAVVKIPEMHNLWWIPIVPLSSLLRICVFVYVHATTSWQPVVTGKNHTLLSDPTILSSGKHHALQPHVRGLRQATSKKRWHLFPILCARRSGRRVPDARI